MEIVKDIFSELCAKFNLFSVTTAVMFWYIGITALSALTT